MHLLVILRQNFKEIQIFYLTIMIMLLNQRPYRLRMVDMSILKKVKRVKNLVQIIFKLIPLLVSLMLNTNQEQRVYSKRLHPNNYLVF